MNLVYFGNDLHVCELKIVEHSYSVIIKQTLFDGTNLVFSKQLIYDMDSRRENSVRRQIIGIY